jgi:hypothetical protein
VNDNKLLGLGFRLHTMDVFDTRMLKYNTVHYNQTRVGQRLLQQGGQRGESWRRNHTDAPLFGVCVCVCVLLRFSSSLAYHACSAWSPTLVMVYTQIKFAYVYSGAHACA